MFKFGKYTDDKVQEYHYSNVYNVERNSSYERVIIGLAKNYIDTVLDLIATLNGPFYMLYVLKVPRTDNESGRYQSELLTYNEISARLNLFKIFFENDSRHDVWIHSPEMNTTIVYDQHNLIYLYGFTDEHINRIKAKGLKNGPVNIPVPHAHCYNEEYDSFESKLINEYQWGRTPLHDEDSQ